MLCGNLKSVGSLESRRGNQNRQARRLFRNRTCVIFLNYGIGKWEPPATGERRVSTGISRVRCSAGRCSSTRSRTSAGVGHHSRNDNRADQGWQSKNLRSNQPTRK
jgi:hypothetical protein